MEQKTIIALILGVLVLVSVVQAVQLYGLKEKVSTGNFKVGAAAGGVSTVAGSGKQVGTVPPSVKELPKMVGGC